jgi:hypothetical protein
MLISIRITTAWARSAVNVLSWRDPPLPVARHELADPGELDTFAWSAGAVLAEPGRQLAEHDQGVKPRRTRIAG